MQLIINTILIVVLITKIIIDIKKIKSNKEVIESDNKVFTAQKELSNKLDERNKILKESYEECAEARKHFEELKKNVTLDYDHLTEEVIERINKLQRSNGSITINI